MIYAKIFGYILKPQPTFINFIKFTIIKTFKPRGENMTVIEKKIIELKSGSFLILLPKWFLKFNNLSRGDILLMNIESTDKITITIPREGKGAV